MPDKGGFSRTYFQTFPAGQEREVASGFTAISIPIPSGGSVRVRTDYAGENGIMQATYSGSDFSAINISGSQQGHDTIFVTAIGSAVTAMITVG